jgi:uncharacterized membrane protein (UPF0127 family)
MKKSSVNYWPTYSLLGVLIIMAGLFAYFTYKNNSNNIELQVSKDSESFVNQITESVMNSPDETITESPWQDIYPFTSKMSIGNTEVNASVAKTWTERITGLSNTPYLPEEVVKLFVFDSSAFHSIWMKDMNYAIDIIWVDEESKIVYIKNDATPESYPESFVSEVPARYVIETKAGFAGKNAIKVGDTVILPKL